MSRLSHFPYNQLTVCMWNCQAYKPPCFTLQEEIWYPFMLRAESVLRPWWRLEGLRKLKISNDLKWNRIRDFAACNLKQLSYLVPPFLSHFSLLRQWMFTYSLLPFIQVIREMNRFRGFFWTGKCTIRFHQRWESLDQINDYKRTRFYGHSYSLRALIECRLRVASDSRSVCLSWFVSPDEGSRTPATTNPFPFNSKIFSRRYLLTTLSSLDMSYGK
jgi:hypothetical protein